MRSLTFGKIVDLFTGKSSVLEEFRVNVIQFEFRCVS